MGGSGIATAFNTSNDYNPFLQSERTIQIGNPFAFGSSPGPAARFIYSEKKASENPHAMASHENVQVQLDDGDELMMAVKEQDINQILEAALEGGDANGNANNGENKLNFSFAESMGAIPAELGQNDSFSCTTTNPPLISNGIVMNKNSSQANYFSQTNPLTRLNSDYYHEKPT
jgi:hypothetical protein